MSSRATLPSEEPPLTPALKLASPHTSSSSSSTSSVLARRAASDLSPIDVDPPKNSPPETRLKRAASTSKTAEDIEKLYLRLQAVIATVQEPARELQQTIASRSQEENPPIPNLSGLPPHFPRDLHFGNEPVPLEGYLNTLPPPIPQKSSRRPRASSRTSTEAGVNDIRPSADVLQQNPDLPCKDDSSTEKESSPSVITADAGLPVIAANIEDEGSPKDLENVENEKLRQRIYQLEQELRTRASEVSSLKSDLSDLNGKYITSINRLEEVQHSKDTIEDELEDLSRQLFETANVMVADEARQRHLLEKSQRVLTAKLQETEETLSNEKSQLKELKVKMETMTLMQPFETQSQSERRVHQSIEFRQRRLSDYSELNKRSAPRSLGHKSVPNSPIRPDGDFTGASSILAPDDVLTQEFASFVSLCADTPLKKLNGLPFLRHCLEEDIENCLRFAPAARIGARRFVDAILNNTLSVSQGYDQADSGLLANNDGPSPGPASPQTRLPPSKQSLLWERFTQGTPLEPGACHACGRLGPCVFRYRLTDQEPWQPLDGFCRDRLVTVCEFYIFIRNLRFGFYSSRSTEELYSEVTRLRLQMFYARIGALSWMDFDRNVLLKAEWVDMSSETSTDPEIPPTEENPPSPAFEATPSTDSTLNAETEKTGPALNVNPPTPVEVVSSGGL